MQKVFESKYMYKKYQKVWGTPNIGKYYKRNLSKSRRKKAKMDILGIPYKSPTFWESECNRKRH